MKNLVKKGAILLFFTTSFCFLACNNAMLGVQQPKAGTATIFITLTESRTAFPATPVDYDAYKYTLTAKNTSGSVQTVFEDKAKSDFSSGFTLDLGTYIFNLTAYTNDSVHKAVLEGSTTLTLEPKDNALNFFLYSVPGDSASATVTLMLPTDSEKDIVKSVKAGVASSPFATSDNCDFVAAIPIAIETTPPLQSEQKVVFTSNAFVTGRDQFVIFYLYDERGEIVASIPESVVSVYGIASTSTITTNAYNLYNKTKIEVSGYLYKQYYLHGEPFNPAGITVTCSVAGRSFQVSLASNSSDTSGYTTDFSDLVGCNKDLTISFRDATCVLDEALNRSDYVFTESLDILPAGTEGTIGTSGTYCNFGDYPQAKKADSVTVSNGVASNGYYIGDDGKLYDKNGSDYYKIEPIKWRILNTSNYQADNNAFLFAENCIDGGVRFYHKKGTDRNNIDRTQDGFNDGNTVHSNNWRYSRIRAYLNCLDGTGYNIDDYRNSGFLNKAFTSVAKSKIYVTSCPNDSMSNTDCKNGVGVNGDAPANTPSGDYVDSPTNDRVFLLSLHEITTDDYGFIVNGKEDSKDDAKKRSRTEYAQAKCSKDLYWLRSQYYKTSVWANKGSDALYVNGNGAPGNYTGVDEINHSIVPAVRVCVTGTATGGSSGQEARLSVTGFLTKQYYAAGELLDLSGITVTYTDSSGVQSVLSSSDYTTNFDSLSGANQQLMIYYGGHDSSDNAGEHIGGLQAEAGYIHKATYQFTEQPRISSHTSTLVTNGVFYEFGDYPQDKIASGVNVSPGRADCGFFIGTDGNYYDKLGNNYYKVSPIIWRALNTSDSDYTSNVKVLLFAEHVLDSGVQYYNDDSYTISRRYSGLEEKRYPNASRTPADNDGNSTPLDVFAYGYNVQIFANNYEYSTVRAYLNSIDARSYHKNDSAYNFTGRGFLSKAFTPEAQKKILRQTVRNGKESAKIADGDNITRTCPDTLDKVFLLSLEELTNTNYGFTNTSDTGSDNARKRYRTEYAEDKGLYAKDGFGHYMTRTPVTGDEKFKYCYFDHNGARLKENVTQTNKGIVPAVWVFLNGTQDTSTVTTPPLGTAWAHAQPDTSGTFDIDDAAKLFDVVGEGYNGGVDGPICIQKGILYPTKGSTASGTAIWLITLSGTEDVEGQATGVWQDLQSGFNGSSAYLTNVVREIQTRIPEGDNLIIAGHSLGGMIAQQVSAQSEIKDNYNVLNVITYGSPLLSEGSREGTLHRLCDLSDIVPFASGSIISSSDQQWLDRDVEDGGYGEEIRDGTGLALHLAGAAGGQRDTTGPHCDSYHRPNVWGTRQSDNKVLYDAVGEKDGTKWIRTDLSTKVFYQNPDS